MLHVSLYTCFPWAEPTPEVSAHTADPVTPTANCILTITIDPIQVDAKYCKEKIRQEELLLAEPHGHVTLPVPHPV